MGDSVKNLNIFSEKNNNALKMFSLGLASTIAVSVAITLAFLISVAIGNYAAWSTIPLICITVLISTFLRAFLISLCTEKSLIKFDKPHRLYYLGALLLPMISICSNFSSTDINSPLNNITFIVVGLRWGAAKVEKNNSMLVGLKDLQRQENIIFKELSPKITGSYLIGVAIFGFWFLFIAMPRHIIKGDFSAVFTLVVMIVSFFKGVTLLWKK